ncbi:MAG: 50S ribosomal protein L5 [Bdellovibrionales bacterium]|nr:50S ribosomal protein L5 [Bdellovibrionales bacterium]
MSVLQDLYQKNVRSQLQKEQSYKNVMEIPKVEKVVLSICVSQAVKDPKILTSVQEDLNLISGQKSVITKAKKAIANFKLREGMSLGAAVTLRREKMWSFLDRLVHFALPQVRDFKGLSPRSFDGRGNYNMGLKEQIVFPEINYDKVSAIRGMNITIVTSAKTDEEARNLLKGLGFPFRN